MNNSQEIKTDITQEWVITGNHTLSDIARWIDLQGYTSEMVYLLTEHQDNKAR